MERHVDLSSLSVSTKVSDWLIFSFLKILLFYILSTFRNNLSINTTQNRLLITSVKIDIFTKSLEVTVHNF